MGTFKKNMNLFGLPYQFRKEVDTRDSSISSSVGQAYIKNVMLDAPMVSIIPGRTKYLPGQSDGSITTHAFIEAAAGNSGTLKNLLSGGDSNTIRYYDFEARYTEYMKYVNILCRTCASFLDITQTIDGEKFTGYSWQDYRQDGSSYKSTTGNIASYAWQKIRNVFSSSTKDVAFDGGSDSSDTLNEVFSRHNYVQFYIDPNVSVNESMSNSIGQSKIKAALDSGSEWLKELSFVGNSAGASMDGLTDLAGSYTDQLSEFVGKNTSGGIGTAISNILSLSSNVIKGENVIIPDIYQNSEYSKSYGITVHLRSPYGTRFGYYMDIVVPLMHLIALAIPKQTSGNSYGSPFLVKSYVPGIYSCNMGMVSSIEINKSPNGDAWSVDGYPTEVDVTLQIADLYSDLSITPSSSPMMFVNNTSLIEYLATTCGLNLIQPQIADKIDMIVQSLSNSITDIPATVAGSVTERIDEMIASVTSLYR